MKHNVLKNSLLMLCIIFGSMKASQQKQTGPSDPYAAAARLKKMGIHDPQQEDWRKQVDGFHTEIMRIYEQVSPEDTMHEAHNFKNAIESIIQKNILIEDDVQQASRSLQGIQRLRDRLHAERKEAEEFETQEAAPAWQVEVVEPTDVVGLDVSGAGRGLRGEAARQERERFDEEAKSYSVPPHAADDALRQVLQASKQGAREQAEIEEAIMRSLQPQETEKKEEEEKKVTAVKRVVDVNPQLSDAEIQLFAQELPTRLITDLVEDYLYPTWATAQEDDIEFSRLKDVVGKHTIHHLTISPNNKYIAAIGRVSEKHGSVFIWDVANKSLINRFDGPDNYLFTSLDFSPDDQYIAAGSLDGKIRVWHVEKKRFRRALKYTLSGQTVAFSPDNTLIALGAKSGDQTVLLWDLKNGKVVRTLKDDLRWPLSSVKFSPNGKLLAASYQGSTRVTLWDIEQGTLVHVYNSPYRSTDFAFSSDSKWLAIGNITNKINLVDVGSGNVVRTFVARSPGHFSETLNWIAMSLDTTLIFSKIWSDADIDIWDRESGEIVRRWSIGADGRIHIFDASAANEGEAPQRTHVALSRDNQYFVISGMQNNGDSFITLCRLKYMRPESQKPIVKQRTAAIAPVPARNLNKELYDTLYELAELEGKSAEPQERQLFVSRVKQLVEQGADPLTVVEGANQSIQQRAVALLGANHPVARYLAYKSWVDKILRLARHLHEESTRNPGEYTDTQQQDLKKVVAIVEEVDKKDIITQTDLAAVELEIYSARHIYLSAPTKKGRAVDIPARPKV